MKANDTNQARRRAEAAYIEAALRLYVAHARMAAAGTFRRYLEIADGDMARFQDHPGWGAAQEAVGETLEELLRRANEDEDRMRGLALRAAEVQMACASALKRTGVERF
ncbi:MAG: hypothetical protein Q3986_07680 [Akkermansia sp.]|nr:hypothetical protein [Akkermansia sp.]